MKSVEERELEIKLKILNIGMENQIDFCKFIEILEEMANEFKIIKIITDNKG